MTTYQCLVVSDTNNVIDYIFATTGYKFIRGASILLDHLNTVAAKELVTTYEGRLLSTGGGEARVLFHSTEQAQAYAHALAKLYNNKTDQVSLSIAIVPRQQQDQQQEKMATWLLRAEEELRLAELTAGKKQLYQTPITPIMKRCEACNQRVAEHIFYEAEAQKAICTSCHYKGEVLKKVASDVQQQQDEKISGLSEVHQLLAKDNPSNKTWIQSIDKLFDDDAVESKIGFVYADGKNIGSLFKQKLNDQLSDEDFIKEYENLSRAIHDSLIHAAARTHKKLVDIGFKEVLVDYALIGGDDLAAILPGNQSLLYTNYLLAYFMEETKARLGQAFELAAGVVIAKKKFPIHQLFNLSYELMARTKYTNTHGTMDFQIILDSAIQSITQKRGDSPIKQASTVRHLYTEGYSVSPNAPFSFLALYKAAQQLKQSGFPSSKIKGIYHLTTEQSEATLQFKWKEWKSRLDKQHKSYIESLHPALKTTPFCLTKEQASYTPLRDLFDLYDLVETEVTLS